MKNNRKFLATALTGAAVAGALGIGAGDVRAVPSTHKLYVDNQPESNGKEISCFLA